MHCKDTKKLVYTRLPTDLFYPLQRISVFFETEDNLSKKMAQFSESFEMLLNNIPEKQREVFLAIAQEGKAKGITGKAFLKRYHLQTPSVVTAAIRGLLEKDFITFDDGAYFIYDPFFALWLRQTYN